MLPDTSVIVEGLLSRLIEKNEIAPTTIYIPEAVIAELEAQANKNREVGYLGLEEVRKLRKLAKKKKFTISFVGVRPSEFQIRRAKEGEIDSLIRDLAGELKATLVSADKVQSLVAECKGTNVILYEAEKIETKLKLEEYFDKKTMSVHIREDRQIFAKKGKPGNWEFKAITRKALSRTDIQNLAKEIIETTKRSPKGYIELDRRGSTIIQLERCRIVITRPPFSDGYEITAVRPIAKLSLPDYKLSEKLKKRILEQAEGILVSGAPGNGKSTFAVALAETYAKQGKVVKTLEAPRDLELDEQITQYSISQGSPAELQDILLLTRPDYTIFDEMRKTEDFHLFSDLRLSGVGMVGIVHATQTIDAIQRFLSRLELGVIPHVVDTVIFIEAGKIQEVYSVSLDVKVPTGMSEADLARPVVSIRDFETDKLKFEIYTFGEQTVVIPIKEGQKTDSITQLAEEQIRKIFERHTEIAKAEIVGPNRAAIYVPSHAKAGIIGKNGSRIEEFEKQLGLSIDVRDLEEIPDSNNHKELPFHVKVTKKSISFILDESAANTDVDIYIGEDCVVHAHASKHAIIKMTKTNFTGKQILAALNKGKDIFCYPK